MINPLIYQTSNMIQLLKFLSLITATMAHSCPFHAKNTLDAINVLSSTKTCTFLALSFSPNDESTIRIATALKSTQSVQSFYLSPEFILKSDNDQRIATLLNAIQENTNSPIKTLGLWHERTSECTDISTTMVASSVISLLKSNVKINGLSIQNHPLGTKQIQMFSETIHQVGLETLSIKVTEDLINLQERDQALGTLFENLGSSASMKSLTIEPIHILGSIGVQSGSATQLGAGLIQNPGTLRQLELRGLKSWQGM